MVSTLRAAARPWRIRTWRLAFQVSTFAVAGPRQKPSPANPYSARQSPDLPPVFSTRRTASMTMPFSAAFSMS